MQIGIATNMINKVLDSLTRISIMLEQLKIIKGMLADDSIRPNHRQRLEEDRRTIKAELRQLYFDLFKVISN